VTDEPPISRRAARDAARGKGSRKATAGPAQPASERPATQPASVPPTAAGFVQPTGAFVTPGGPTAQPTVAMGPVATDAAVAGDGAEAAPAKGGIGALLRRHPVAWSVGAGVVAFALLGTGAVFAGAAWADRDRPAAVDSDEPVEELDRPLPAELASATRLRTCSIAPQASDPRLGMLLGTIIRADTGEVLFDRIGDLPAPSMSATKVLTAAAAIAKVGPDYQVTTSVYEGSTPGTIVLVGRGDATLSALPAGQESFYPGAPKLQTLAEATIANYRAKYPDTPITRIVLDATWWNPSDRWNETWDRGELNRGTISQVTALQVDGDRNNPREATSARSNDPIGRAGSAFIAALRNADPDGETLAEDVTTVEGSAVGNVTLAEVRSQPIREWIKQMLLTNDNTLAEMLARIVSSESDAGGTAASLQQAIAGSLMTFDVPIEGVTVVDGSGLSPANAVPTRVMTDLMRKILIGNDGLDVVRGAMPVAGTSGMLVDRFTGDNTQGRNNVVGAAGAKGDASTLSGWFAAADGVPIAFSFTAVAEGLKAADARAALDTLTIAALRCGDNLSDN